ncbi:major capsid protein [Bartonella sp. DGB2]|uniref:major capsid protein n=1 Tax=Bartonella sp. DGB2 TaxID=3388426 RepID=UPI00398F9A08
MQIDIFNDDAFSAINMTKALDYYDFKPDLIGSLKLFDDVPISTTHVAIERRNNQLQIIRTSERGAPLEEAGRERRDIRAFRTVRLAKGNTLSASEIQNVRAFGSESELETAIEYISRAQDRLTSDMEVTLESHMFGAIQGVVLDADGSVIIDWFKEWGITPPQDINFALDSETTQVERICREIIRTMQRASKGAYRLGSSVIGLCGDKFFDDLTNHKTVRETFLNTQNAQTLNRSFGAATASVLQSGSFASFDYGGIRFINYRGVDDYDDKAQAGTKRALGIRPNECQFVPVNTPGVFQQAFSPCESFAFANTIGRPLYSMLIRDIARDFWVRPEVYSYPLFICTRPEMLIKGVTKK